MRLRTIAPTYLIEAVDPHEFGTITHGPEWYLHYAHTDEQIKSIEKIGFDLKHFGHTSKKYNVLHMMTNDPLGVFATEFTGLDHVDKYRPFVIFNMLPIPNVLTRPTNIHGESADLKVELARAYGGAGKKLTSTLLKADIQVVHSIFEYIILDPKRIQIAETSIRLKEAGLL